MDIDTQQAQLHATQSAPANAKVAKKDRPKWNRFKGEIQQLYLHEDRTLAETMEAIKLRHGFTASVRTWKSVMKEWGFEKHIPSEDMKFVVAKQEKRRLEAGKETRFFRGDLVINAERIETFKKRKTTKEVEAFSPIADTPAEITYATPCSEESATVEAMDIDSLRPNCQREMNHAMSISTNSPNFNLPGDSQERLYFQYLCERTAKTICGALDPTLWTERIPQACYQEPPIRHATIALTALAMSLENTYPSAGTFSSALPRIDPNHLDKYRSYALKQYSKAISSMRSMLSDGRQHLTTSLIACVLFMSFEALQGHYEAALIHFHAGEQLLTDWKASRSSSPKQFYQDPVIEDLGRLFIRLDTHMLIGLRSLSSSPSTWRDITFVESFGSTEEARGVWDILFNEIARFYYQSFDLYQRTPETLLSNRWLERHEYCTTQLLRWRDAFQVVHAKEIRAGITDDSVILFIYYDLATILLAYCVECTEMIFDQYTDLFAGIISRCEYLLTGTDGSIDKPNYTLDLGVMVPLVFTACSCRDRKLRYQAIELLRSNPRREGLSLDSITWAHVCSWLSSIEFEDMTEDADLVPESARYYNFTKLVYNPVERRLTVQAASATIRENGQRSYRETTFSL